MGVDEAAPSGSCSTDKVTGITDNGTGLTDLGYYIGNTSPVDGALKTYYGFTPALGTHNIVISASASCILYAVVGTYTGVKQSGLPDASGSGNPLNDSGAVTLFQATTTTASNNAWAILIGVPSTAGVGTAGPGTTIRQQQSGAIYFADSGGPISPAGPVGLSLSKTSAHWAANYFSIPAVASNPGTSATTTYSYDNNGNVTAVGTTTSYSYDFENRLTQSVISGATTTYAYDPFGNRVSQTIGSTSIFYPNKYFSITTTTSGSSTVATSTDYVYSGSNLLATVDQPLVNGIATGTPITRYNHPDNLGSANVTSDANGALAQWFDYAPYGSVLASENIASTTAARQFIGQFSDSSGLSYLNARYYSPTQGQFISQDPLFLGAPSQQNLQNPQSLNSYSYSDDNPTTSEDPSGKYGEISGTVVIPGRSFSAGIRFDPNGIDYFVGYGVGAGAEAGIEYAWAPGQELAHHSQATVSINAEYADVVGGRVSQDILTYSTNQKKLITNAGPSGAVVLGAGEAADVESQITAPIPGLDWGTPSKSETQLYAGPTQLSSYHPTVSQTHTSYSSQSGGGSGRGGIGQALSNLYNTLVQLSAALSSYSSNNNTSH